MKKLKQQLHNYQSFTNFAISSSKHHQSQRINIVLDEGLQIQTVGSNQNNIRQTGIGDFTVLHIGCTMSTHKKIPYKYTQYSNTVTFL